MWHPLRLAEDYATADVLTEGRVVFGVGRGYHTREVETFGSPLLDQAGNRELFEEQVDIMFKAFNQESFSHRGKNYVIPPDVPYRGYELKEITLVPRPVNLPVECWQPIQSATSRGMDLMAGHGISGIIGGGSSEGGRKDSEAGDGNCTCEDPCGRGWPDEGHQHGLEKITNTQVPAGGDRKRKEQEDPRAGGRGEAHNVGGEGETRRRGG